MNKDGKLVMEPKTAQRKYKDTLFRMIFRDQENLLKLYNAVNGTDYQNPEELQIVTLENAIYMNMKNDLACIIDCRMNMYEHQSSVNANMPLRNLFYVAMEYHDLVSKKSLYSSRLIKLPTPYFVVFYNGRTNQPERREMKLSDAFLTPVDDPALELKVVQLNIRAGHNRELMDKCPILAQYAEYVERVQQYAEDMSLEVAVKRAVNECIKEGVLADFLQKHKAEAIEVSIFEYDEEKELKLFGEAEREQGELKKLVDQVCRKLRKGKSAEVIAEELEEELKNILPICESASEYAPDYDSHQVYEKVRYM